MKRWLSWGGGGVVLFVTVAACRQIVGIGDDPPVATVTDCGGLPYAGACASCLSSNCCQQASACPADPSCKAYESCLGACKPGDAECLSRCTADATPLGATAGIASLETCLASQCRNECGLQCGYAGAVEAPPDAATACAACVDRNACAAFGACQRDPECNAQALCGLTCEGRGDCLTGCGIFVDPPPMLYDQAAQAFLGACVTACATGANWACIGHIAPPVARVGTAAIEAQVIDAAYKTAQQGIQVAACSVETCAPPGAVTDAHGAATIDFPLPMLQEGPAGFLELTTAPDAGAAPVLPTRIYWGFPLAGPSMLLQTTPVETPADRSAIYSLAGINPLPARGDLVLHASDCIGVSSPGIRFEVEASGSGAQVVYLEDESPTPSATATDASGLAIVGNVPPGQLSVTAYSVGLGRPVSRVDNISIEADTLTEIFLPPLL